MSKTPFKFWVPIDNISKAKDEDSGQEKMVLGGIASTADEDTDEETLLPEGFDITYLKERGLVNWNHKKDPDCIIGEPSKAEKRKEGLYVEASLYPDSDLAKKVYKLAQVLASNSKSKRKLGFSIEGKATERDPLNPKIVKKAMITGIAITHSPKNSKSIIDVIKSNFEGDEGDELMKDLGITSSEANGGTTELIVDIERKDGTKVQVDANYNVKIKKCMDTTSGAAVTRESLDEDEKVQTYDEKPLSKAEIYERIFDLNPVISLEKAHTIYQQINSYAMKKGTKASKEGVVTNSLLEKALDNLFATPKKEDEIAKGNETTLEKGEGAEGETTEEQAAADTTITVDNPVDLITKAFESTFGKATGETTKLIKSLAVVNKVALDRLDKASAAIDTLQKGHNDLMDLNKSLVDSNNLLQNNLSKALVLIEEMGGQPNQRKSTTAIRQVERTFEKGNTGGDLGGGERSANVLSVTANKKQILNMLDEGTFEKGFNNELAQSMTSFEATSDLNETGKNYLKSKGYEVVQ